MHNNLFFLNRDFVFVPFFFFNVETSLARKCRGDCAKCVFVESEVTSLVLDLHCETCLRTDDVCMYRLKFGGAIHLWSTFTNAMSTTVHA